MERRYIPRMAYSSMREFADTLEKHSELVRISEPVSTELEITALANREMKSPGGGKALLIEKPVLPSGKISAFPVLINAFGSEKRMALSLEVKHVDEVADQIAFLLKAKPPRSLGEAWDLLRAGFDAMHAKPARVRTGPCKDVIVRLDQGATDFDLTSLPALKSWPKDGGPFLHPAHGLHAGPRHRRPQYRHVPHANLRRPHHRHALADAQGRRAPRQALRRDRPAHAGRGLPRRRPGHALLRDRADAGWARRGFARGIPAQEIGAAGEVRDDRPRGARAFRLRHRGLRRPERAVAAGGSVRRSHRLLHADRQLSRVSRHLHHPPARRDLSRDHRGQAADGGPLYGPCQRAAFPAHL